MWDNFRRTVFSGLGGRLLRPALATSFPPLMLRPRRAASTFAPVRATLVAFAIVVASLLGSSLAHAGTSSGVYDAGTSSGVSDAGTSAGVYDAGTSSGVYDAGTSAGVYDAGTSAGVSDAGIPAVVSDAGIPAVVVPRDLDAALCSTDGASEIAPRPVYPVSGARIEAMGGCHVFSRAFFGYAQGSPDGSHFSHVASDSRGETLELPAATLEAIAGEPMPLVAPRTPRRLDEPRYLRRSRDARKGRVERPPRA